MYSYCVKYKHYNSELEDVRLFLISKYYLLFFTYFYYLL